MAEPINKKYLSGLKYRTNQVKNSAEGKIFVPVERKLTPGDVLDWREEGSELIIVTGDGRKYRVERKPAAEDQDESGKGEE
jgi:hypothetical protein